MNFETIAIYASFTLALTQGIKSFLPKDKDGNYVEVFKIGKRKFHWGQIIFILSLAVGTGVVALFTKIPLRETVALGVIAGSMASGFFAGSKSTLPTEIK